MAEADNKTTPAKKRTGRRGRPMELLSESDLSLNFTQQLESQQQQLMNTVKGGSEANLNSSGGATEGPNSSDASSSGDVTKLQEDLKQVEKERDQLKQEKGAVEEELTKLKAQLADANARADDVERERDDLASRERTLQTQISAAESVKRSKEREIQNLKDDVDSANQKHRQLEEELKRSKEKVKSLSDSSNSSSSEKERRVDELEQKVSDLQRELNSAKESGELQKRKLAEAQQQLEEETKKVRGLEAELSQLRTSSREQTMKAASLAESFATERASLRSEIDSLKQKLAAADSPLNQKAATVTDPRLKLELDQSRTENGLLVKENKGLKTEISRLQNEINNLKANSSSASVTAVAEPPAATSGLRSVWGRRSPAPEITTPVESSSEGNEEAPPPPPKRSVSPNPRASQPSSFFSIFNKLREPESPNSNRLSQSLLGSVLLTSSATSTPGSLTSSNESTPAPIAPEVQIQNLLSAVNETVASISLHFNAATNEKEREEFGDDSKDPRIASLVRGKLSTSLAVIFNYEFNPFTIWGTPHIWDYIVAATSENVSVTNLSALSLTKTVKDLTKMSNDNNVRFRSLIAAGLNNHSLHEWIILLSADERATSKHYEKTALLMNQEAVKDLSVTLKVLNYFPFQLDLNFEATPREKPAVPPRAVEIKCTKHSVNEAGDKQPSFFCKTCKQTEEASAFCAACALQVHQGHTLSLANYSNFVCKGSTATVAAAAVDPVTPPTPPTPLATTPAPTPSASTGPLLSASDLI